jgi:hypothetical protein
MMVPVYSITAFFSIKNPEEELYLAAIRDFYEAYVLYNFI